MWTPDASAGPPGDRPAPRGMVATSHPLAVRAALDVLDDGGTAVDAAVAAAAMLCVVDPRSTGLGGDVFALVWEPGASRPTGLAGAGGAPAALTVDALRAAGHRTMPIEGPLSITVPGAPAAWEQALERFGKLDRERVLAPAIAAARDGFVVTPAVAAEWASTVDKLARDEAAAAAFLPGGRAPREGERFAVPTLALTLERFAAEGAAPFYTGELAERIVTAVAAAGGVLSGDDLAGWGGPREVEPLTLRFRDVDVYQMPPPGQGLVVLEALGVYAGCADLVDRVADEHVAIEALKLAYDDANRHLADPDFVDVPVDHLLSRDHLDAQRGRILADAVLPAAVGRPSDTVYVAVADADGGACSFIQSVYDGFGSGVGVPGTGLVLQNRASGFTLAEGHPNAPAPGKRPFHTIIPAMLGRGDDFLGCLGVVGGYMQTQGQVQVLRHLIDGGRSPQEAVDAPRFRVYRGAEVALEEGYPAELAAGLAARGHELTELAPFERGGAQLVLRDDDGFRGGSDRRKDGYAGGR